MIPINVIELILSGKPFSSIVLCTFLFILECLILESLRTLNLVESSFYWTVERLYLVRKQNDFVMINLL